MVLGSGIRDPGSGKNPFRIPDPGVKKAPDPGSGSATLAFCKEISSKNFAYVKLVSQFEICWAYKKKSFRSYLGLFLRKATTTQLRLSPDPNPDQDPASSWKNFFQDLLLSELKANRTCSVKQLKTQLACQSKRKMRTQLQNKV